MPNTAPLSPAHAETLVAPSLALEETAPSNPHLELTDSLPSTTSQAQARARAPTSSMRTTVLPRVELVDAKPRLVVEGKRRFEPIRHLGEGGHGEVTGVRDHDIGRNVAIKRLRADVRSPGTALRFAEEVRTVGQLEHPNIVPIHDVGLDENGDYYFVMKYVEGETLESVIEKLAAGDADAHERYGVERRVQIFIAVLEAVAYAHAKGIVHRDIKPANVMIGAYGEVALMDWGVAKRRSEASGGAAAGVNDGSGPATATATPGRRGTLFETRAGDLVGTPAYMSPEQARGDAVDERSDVYALSLLFHELLCLSHPLAEMTTLPAMLHAVIHTPVPHTSFVRSRHQPPVPAELGWFVRRGLAKDPAARFQSVSEMLSRLERRADGSFPIQCPITLTKRVLGGLRRFVDHRPLLALSSFAATFVVFALSAGMLGWRALH